MTAGGIPELPGLETENLYRQETYTDLKVGTLQVLTPVKEDGAVDEDRPVRFVGSTSILTQQGMLPVQADIEAKDLAEAIGKFSEAMKKGVEDMVDRAREMEEKMRSEIVVARGDVGSIPPVGAGGGPGQNVIQMP